MGLSQKGENPHFLIFFNATKGVQGLLAYLLDSTSVQHSCISMGTRCGNQEIKDSCTYIFIPLDPFINLTASINNGFVLLSSIPASSLIPSICCPDQEWKWSPGV